MIAEFSGTSRDFHSDYDPELAEGEEEESVVDEAAKKQIAQREAVVEHPCANSAQGWAPA